MRPLSTAVAFVLLSAACAPARPPAAPAGPRLPEGRPLDVDPAAPELQRTPALRERLRSGPHAYFRFVNRAFAHIVCQRFADVDLPAVTLHGDAHIEQYAVTDLGRGLTDFDDSSAGPAVVDLVRFGASLRLAAHQRGWEDEGDRLWSRFWSGYERALLDPGAEAPEPALARRLQAGFDSDRLALLARAEAFIETLPEPRPMLDEKTRDETLVLLARNSGVAESFFRVKRAGAISVGIGSAADEKYLFRVEGPTAADDDDVLLEFKEIRNLDAVPCIHSVPGPSRFLLGQSRLAYQPFLYTGAVHAGGVNFWVHSWPLNYVELRIADLRSPDELEEVVYDVGVQLGRGHPKRWSAHEAVRLRHQLARGIPRDRVAKVAAELAAETLAAWGRFKEATPP
jgi:hypothetical protein